MTTMMMTMMMTIMMMTTVMMTMMMMTLFLHAYMTARETSARGSYDWRARTHADLARPSDQARP